MFSLLFFRAPLNNHRRLLLLPPPPPPPSSSSQNHHPTLEKVLISFKSHYPANDFAEGVGWFLEPPPPPLPPSPPPPTGLEWVWKSSWARKQLLLPPSAKKFCHKCYFLHYICVTLHSFWLHGEKRVPLKFQIVCKRGGRGRQLWRKKKTAAEKKKRNFSNHLNIFFRKLFWGGARKKPPLVQFSNPL